MPEFNDGNDAWWFEALIVLAWAVIVGGALIAVLIHGVG